MTPRTTTLMPLAHKYHTGRTGASSEIYSYVKLLSSIKQGWRYLKPEGIKKIQHSITIWQIGIPKYSGALHMRGSPHAQGSS